MLVDIVNSCYFILINFMIKNPNLLVIGASGGVANALLHHLVSYRNLFGKLVLLDKNKKVLTDPYIDHVALNYSFI